MLETQFKKAGQRWFLWKHLRTQLELNDSMAADFIRTLDWKNKKLSSFNKYGGRKYFISEQGVKEICNLRIPRTHSNKVRQVAIDILEWLESPQVKPLTVVPEVVKETSTSNVVNLQEYREFSFKNLPVRTKFIDGQVIFILKDCCQILGIQNHKDVAGRLKTYEKYGVDIIDSIGRKQVATGITESGLYKLIFQSRKPEAEAFQDWVCETVLPEIRKTGSYQGNMTSEEKQIIDIVLGLHRQAKKFEAEVHQLKQEKQSLMDVLGDTTQKLLSFAKKIN